jgi:hypothetical protein
MSLPKGRTNNPYGRPRGSINKANILIREKLGNYLEQNLEKLLLSLDETSPKERLIMTEKLLKFAIPSRVEQVDAVKYEDDENRLSLENLTDEEHLQFRILCLKSCNALPPEVREQWADAIRSRDIKAIYNFQDMYAMKF